MNDKLYQIEMIDKNDCIDYSCLVYESELQAYKDAKENVETGGYKGFYIRELLIVKRGN